MSIPLLTTTLIPEISDFKLSRTERINKSKFTEASQVISSPTGLWTASLKFSNIRRADAQELIAFLWALRGSFGQFRLFDWSSPNADGTGGQYFITDVASALPGMVKMSSVHANTKIASAGNYVEINGELKGLVADVVTDNFGVANVIFEPFLRVPANAATMIRFDQPTGVFRLEPGYEVPRPTSKKMVLAEITIPCIEYVTATN
ncbi:hypothetical protein [Vibrio fluvialis]|uniref:hypothetical protein n=1 Tax=Vibrio fluvialis TaxID=676 RepID=UPI001C9BD895|nr:hypothetical protein [Vibrio fluvialis]